MQVNLMTRHIKIGVHRHTSIRKQIHSKIRAQTDPVKNDLVFPLCRCRKRYIVRHYI